jgi:hypothetical protein
MQDDATIAGEATVQLSRYEIQPSPNSRNNFARIPNRRLNIYREPLPFRSIELNRKMRLLEGNNDGGFSLTKDFLDNIPCYAILSHTWGADTEEVTFRDLVDGMGKSKTGYDKIRFCGEQARRDGLRYFWVDTCCIDKSSSAELAEAINSMFRWYRDAAKCYVNLSDVSIGDCDQSGQLSQFQYGSAFQGSRWFTRGWTL